MNQDIHRCAICAAEFASSAELVRHERTHRSSAAEHHGREPAPEKPRAGREFSRRNQE